MESILQLMMFPARVRFQWKNRNRRRVTLSVIASIRENHDTAKQRGIEDYCVIFNAGLFVVLAEQDISTYSECIFMARSEWHRQFHARNLATLLYELDKNLPIVLGKPFLAAIASVDVSDKVRAHLADAQRVIRRLSRDRRDFLYDIRTFVGAHREKDARLQLDKLEGIRPLDVYGAAAEISVAIRSLTQMFQVLIAELGQPTTLVKHIGEAMGRNAN